MNVADSIKVLKTMLDKYPTDGSSLFFPKRDAIKTAIKVMELSLKK